MGPHLQDGRDHTTVGKRQLGRLIFASSVPRACFTTRAPYRTGQTNTSRLTACGYWVIPCLPRPHFIAKILGKNNNLKANCLDGRAAYVRADVACVKRPPIGSALWRRLRFPYPPRSSCELASWLIRAASSSKSASLLMTSRTPAERALASSASSI